MCPLSKPRYTLLTRPGCELCEHFEQAFWAQVGPDGAELIHMDVDSREDWRRRWGLKIPVLLDETGAAVCVSAFDPEALH